MQGNPGLWFVFAKKVKIVSLKRIYKYLLQLRLFNGDNFTLYCIIFVLKLFYKLLRGNPAWKGTEISSCLVMYAQKANGKYDTNKKIITRKSLSQSTFSLTANPLHFLFQTSAFFAFFLQTKTAEQYFLPLGLFIIWLFKAVLTVTIQRKATEQYVPLAPRERLLFCN